MELAIILLEFALFCLVLFVISFQLWRIHVDQQAVLDKLAKLSAAIDALPATQPPVDLQPIGDAVDAIQAKVDARNPPAA
jgi:hypothetical protein